MGPFQTRSQMKGKSPNVTTSWGVGKHVPFHADKKFQRHNGKKKKNAKIVGSTCDFELEMTSLSIIN